MSKEELIKKLRELARRSNNGGDPEVIHPEADELLIEYIGDEKVKKAFDRIKKWYA